MQLWLGFLLGLSGSLHCVGMCGPIAYLLPVKKGVKENIQRLHYHLGRIITYTLLGLFFGALGWTIDLSSMHQIISILLGVFLILWSLIPFTRFIKKSEKSVLHQFENFIQKQFTRIFKNQTPFRMLLLGILNGFLPCGLVYVAISGSLYYANPVPASLFMIGFGLGTIPLLYLVQQFPKKSVLFKRWKTQYLLAFIGFLVGLLILLRGLGLGIPYLSPPTQKMNLIEATNHNCSL